MAYVPEDRSATGSAPDLSVAENLALKAYRKPPIGQRPLDRLRRHAEPGQDADPGIRHCDARPATPARKLSGGNLQKVILAREISGQPNVLVAASPTRGLDIGATENVRKLLLQQRSEGAAILLISEDLDEIFAMSDRIAVIYEGRIMGVFPVAEADLATVGLLMAGGEQPRQNNYDRPNQHTSCTAWSAAYG